MKKLVIGCCAVLLLCGTVQAEETFGSDHEKAGYAIGMNIGTNLKEQLPDVDLEQLVEGLSDALVEQETKLTSEEMMVALMELQQRLQQEILTDNAAASEAFMLNNAEQEGVVSLASGLQYKIIESGDGVTPTADSEVEVHYQGTLIDGTEFDSSYSRGEPASFFLSDVIAGWTEALQLMKEGDKWQLAIPPALAYGEAGAGDIIPPNSALVFEVELLKVN